MASGWDSVGAVSHPFNEVLDEKATEKASRIKKQVSLAAAAAAEPLPWEAVAAKLAEDVEDEQKTEGGFRSGGDSRDGVRPERGGDEGVDETFEELVKRRVFQSTATVYKSNGAVYNDLWSSGVSHIRHWR